MKIVLSAFIVWVCEGWVKYDFQDNYYLM